MAMTIGSWQKELHHEQIVLDKIISALRRKKDLKNAEKLEKLRERLRTLAYQPISGAHITGGGGMVMTTEGLQKCLHHEQIELDNITSSLRENVERIQGVRKRLTVLAYLPIGEEIGMEEKVSDAEIILEKDEIDCPCGSVTQINAKIINTGSVKDSFTVEFSEGGVDSNLVIEAWAECGKTTPELAPRESYPFVVNIKPACSAFGVSQVGLSDRIRITVESMLEETDKDRKYLKVNVK
ncbi:MAG: hypothetical protein QMC80_09385 [Thermoplasmatales archaeon]|nr:hypothetical protein [Thermoplasmatales archaeon]